MPCDRVSLPDGTAVILCSRGPRRQRCACGKPATLLCDWKLRGARTLTCDAPICAACATSPAPEKDLCPTHAAAFREWSARRQPERTA
jgi:hypothetical protein